MFDLKKIKKYSNLEINIYKNNTIVIEKLEGGEIYHNLKNDIPYMFNKLKFERKQRKLENELFNEISHL